MHPGSEMRGTFQLGPGSTGRVKGEEDGSEAPVVGSMIDLSMQGWMDGALGRTPVSRSPQAAEQRFAGGKAEEAAPE
jgi:hypothetical protein